MITKFKKYEPEVFWKFWYIPYSSPELILLAVNKINIINKEKVIHAVKFITQESRNEFNRGIYLAINTDPNTKDDNLDIIEYIPCNYQIDKLYAKKQYIKQNMKYQGILKLEPYEIAAHKYNL